MTATASKLGSSPLTCDWSALAAVKSPVPDLGRLTSAWTHLKSRFASGEIGFYQSIVDNALSQAEESVALSESLLQRKHFTDCLCLGIGGSALGPLTLLQALPERGHSGVRFHFLDNPDPFEWRSTLSRLNPESTLVVSIAKSGSTFETMAQTLCALEWLGKDRFSSHFVAITDPHKGDLGAFARSVQAPTLSIAPSIGGRFSVFSPVGLFPAALAGLSVSDFLTGARQVHDFCEKHPLDRNPLMILAGELLRHRAERNIHVCMPYSSRLRMVGDWFVQLWGESLGKDGKGFTPVAALGATDQHSLLQLLRDGPDDKITCFITVDQVEDPVKIPKLSSMLPIATHPFAAFGLLEGHTFHELLETEYRATSLVLTRRNRPHFTFLLDRLDERNLGALFFSMAVLTAITGTLDGVDPFDQPGVEEAKIYIRESLSRKD